MLELSLDADAEYKEMEKAGKKGLLGRFNARFNDALQNSRGDETTRDAVAETAGAKPVSVDDLAMRRPHFSLVWLAIQFEPARYHGCINRSKNTSAMILTKYSTCI